MRQVKRFWSYWCQRVNVAFQSRVQYAHPCLIDALEARLFLSAVAAVDKVFFQNTTMGFAAADFSASFTPTNNGGSLQTVKITALPTAGTLALNNNGTLSAVTLNQQIPVAQTANLVYTPNNGYAGVDGFTWNGSDGTVFAAAAAKVNLEEVVITQQGIGAPAADGDSIQVNYTGYLLVNGQQGAQFDTSLQSGRTPFDLTLGAGSVIKGWDLGLVSMQAEESCTLYIPSDMGYGVTGSAPSIPPNSDLMFTVHRLNPTIAITGGANHTPLADGQATTSSTDGTNFGMLAATNTFTLIAGGDGTLESTRQSGQNIVQLSGPNADQFVVTQPASTATANQYSFTVTYQPTHGGLSTASINIPTNAPFNPNFTFEVQGGAPILAFPHTITGTTAGSFLAPIVVNVQDSNGHVVTTDNSSVTLSIAAPANGGALSGTTTVQAVNGVATFTGLSITPAGSYSLLASDGNLATATSNSFNIITNPASKLAFSQQPAAAAVGAVLSAISVQVLDPSNTLVGTDTSNVTLTIASGPNGGTLGGTTTVTAVNGVATFSNLTFSAEGTYTLTATDASLTHATSSNIVVINATLAASKLNILLGATETLTASVISTGGTPSGSVTFFDGATSLGSVALTNGTAAMDVTTLAFGVHSVTFTYSGDTNYPAVTSAPADIFVGNTKNQVIVNALYRQLLNRDAEETAGGLYSWVTQLDNGTPLSKVADGIATSVEYDGDIVTSIYEQYLHRGTDPTGLHNWVAQMQAGTVSYEQIRGYILGSQEFQNDAVNQYGDYVTGLYQVLLGRNPDPTGTAYWNGILGALTSNSPDSQRDPVSIGISTSFEQYEDFVAAKFHQFLGRSPTAATAAALPAAQYVTPANPNGIPTPTSTALQGEQGYWADSLNTGLSDGDFIADILSSTEYLTLQGLL
jgi:hypothetical protein